MSLKTKIERSLKNEKSYFISLEMDDKQRH